MVKLLWISIGLAVASFFAALIFIPLPDQVEYSTIITGNKNEVLHAFLTRDEKWRMKTSLEEISPLLMTTIVQKEDKYFYCHFGVNPFAIGRALIKNTLHLKRTSGASTITMQVARALEPKRRNYISKLIEVFRAYQLEMKYSKKEILQLYCNLLPYGGNIEGVKSAAVMYFNKEPDHLSLAEITALCVIPNRPSSLVPGKHNSEIVLERNRWLRLFEKQNVFTSKQIEDALAEPFNAVRSASPKLIPHLAVQLKEHEAPVVHSTIDINIQSRSEKLAKDYVRTLRSKNINNASIVIIDNNSHEIIAYIGSADFKDTVDAGQVDGATAVRQPGSTLKPLLYGMCIDEGLLTPKSVIADVGINYDGYAPENYDRRFNGYVSLEYALGHSLNIPAVRSLERLGHDKLVRALTSCDFRQIKRDRKKLGLSMVLGGCGASLLELTSLYSAFANGGLYVRPHFSKDQRTLYKFQVVSASAAFMINETLSKINRPDFPLNWQSTEHMPKIAWKTGTSYGRRDAWSIGYNKRYTVGVWVGNFSGQGIPELSGAEIATPLLFRLFNTLDYDTDQEWFSQPADCDTRMVCSETGMPPSDYCTNIVMDYFIPTVSPALRCNNTEELIVSPDEKISYCRVCMPASDYKRKRYRIVPAEMESYFDQHHVAYQKIPMHNPTCEKVFRLGQPNIIFPKNGMEYLISKADPEPLQLHCRAGNDVSRVHWYIDNRFYKTSDARTPQYFMPTEGPVKISCTDDKGRNKNIQIIVRYIDL